MSDEAVRQSMSIRGSRRAVGPLILILGMAATGCNALQRPSPTPIPSQNAYGGGARQVVAAEVEDFGWTEDGEVYFSLAVEGGRRWYQFDPATGSTRESQPPRPEVPPEAYERLTEGGTVQVLTAIVSPSGDKILYERRPEGFTTPSFETPIPDYSPPSELWLAEGTGVTRSRLGPLCGTLNPEVTWLQDETLVFGSCAPPMGLSIIFLLADLDAQAIQEISFLGATGGEEILPFQADVSHDEQWLAFTDGASEHLWRIPVSDLVGQIGQPLSTAQLVPVDGPLYSPEWSPDDRWIYYWQSPPYGPDSDFYDLVLMRANPTTGNTEQVLTSDDLITEMGSSGYSTLGFTFGIAPDWRLSSDAGQALIRISETSRTAPGLLILSLAGR